MSCSFQLENDHVSVVVNATGSEIRSVYDKRRARELLWSGNPEIWSGTAPILFPVVGRMRGGGFEYQGTFYPMPIHGFAAQSEFSVVESASARLVLELRDSNITRKSYPFSFILRVTFSLCEQGVSVGYVVENPSAASLVFSIGSHPAFALPGVNMQQARAELRFSSVESDTCHRIRGGLLGAKEAWDLQGDRLPLREATFAEDAIILRDVSSSRIALYCQGERVLEVDTGGMPHLGLWSKPNAPYVCIEPWMTTDDARNAPMDIEKKPGFVHLAPAQRYCCGYQISM